MPAEKRKAASANPRARRPRDTRERIIQRSIVLFNRKGLRNVAIDRIASDLKISPGNLTYHFRRKNDLIRATMDVLQERLRTALERPIAVRSPQDGAEYLVRLYRMFWDFRFFFNALTHLLADANLRREYYEFRDWALTTMEGDLDYLCEQGYFLRPSLPNSYRLLAENMWSQWLHWLRMQQIENASASTPADAALYDCALHNWSLCQPLMHAGFAEELLKVFQNLLRIKTTAAPARNARR